jgi:hypothetical protein
MEERWRREKIKALKLSKLRKITCKKREESTKKRFERRTYRKREKVEVDEEGSAGQLSFGANGV